MKSSIIRAIEKAQADRPEAERFDLSRAKAFNKTRCKPPSAEDQAACKKYIGGPRSVMGRPFGESFSD